MPRVSPELRALYRAKLALERNADKARARQNDAKQAYNAALRDTREVEKQLRGVEEAISRIEPAAWLEKHITQAPQLEGKA